MNCQQCGAPLSVGAETCDYCGSPTDLGRANLDKVLERKRKDTLLSMKSVSPGMLVLVCVVTGGIYSPLWYILRKKSLERLSPKSRLSPLLLWLYLAVSVAFFILPQEGPRAAMNLSPEAHDNIYTLIACLVPGLSIWLAFQVRRMLQNYASAYLDKKVVVETIAPSGVALVFFGVIYLQLQINKMIAMELLNPEISKTHTPYESVGE